jgi:adenylate cyclase
VTGETELAGISPQPKRPLFAKYFAMFFAAVVLPLLANGASEAWFGYRDRIASINHLLHVESNAAAGKIQTFIDGINGQLSWTVRLQWGDGVDSSHRFETVRLMRQVPAISELTLVDGNGIERIRISRLQPDVAGSGLDRSQEASVIGARSSGVWYGPVMLKEGSEPYVLIAVAGPRASGGVAIAEINLKLIWDVIAAIKIGKSGEAFVVDGRDQLVAHPDLSLVLKGDDDALVVKIRAMREAANFSGPDVRTMWNLQNQRVLAVASSISGPDWAVFAAEPVSEALEPVWSAFRRTFLLLLGGTCLAVALSYLLARRVAEPIQLLGEGAQRIGLGDFAHRIRISTGDEFEGLAARFNEMAVELAVSQQRSERIGRLKRFLAPQVAELVEHENQAALLDSRRTEVVPVFCDLRNFTGFASKAEANDVMNLLKDYYSVLGKIITRHEATLTNLAGDGLMVLLNAPVPRPDPAVAAVMMACEMQQAMRSLVDQWRKNGNDLGFGIGLAMGEATVGRIGYDERSDYTAIGNVVNLASRMCANAQDGQILVDRKIVESLHQTIEYTELGARSIKGFADSVPVYSIEWRVN